MKIAFLTNQEHFNLFKDDQLTLPFFKNINFDIFPLVWTDINLSTESIALKMLQEFDAIIIRSPWDYHKYFTEFLSFLKFCDKNKIKVFNPINVLLWNLDKHYLDEFELNQIPTIPTVWTNPHSSISIIQSLIEKYETIIFKPSISAGSANTFKLDKNNFSKNISIISEVMTQKKCMLQPYLNEIETEGELSLIYFEGKFSHAIVKKPKKGDFRTQDKFGGSIQTIVPSNSILAISNKTIHFIQNKFNTTLLYARIDLVKWKKNWVIIEAEVVEPQLYFQYDESSLKRFVQAVSNYLLK